MRQWSVDKRYGRYTIEEYWTETDEPEKPRSHPIHVGEMNLASEIADALNQAYEAGVKDAKYYRHFTTFNYKNETEICSVKYCVRTTITPNTVCSRHSEQPLDDETSSVVE